MEFRLGKSLILDEPEVERLLRELPDGWSDPVYEALARGDAHDPWDVRTLFDVTLRDALDETVAESWQPSPEEPEMPIGRNYDVVESALHRIWTAWPQTDVTVGNTDGGPLPSGWEITVEKRDGPDEGILRIADRLWAAALWAQALASRPPLSASEAQEVWLDPEAAIANGEATGIPEAEAEVALAQVLRLLCDVFEVTYPLVPEREGQDEAAAATSDEPPSDA